MLNFCLSFRDVHERFAQALPSAPVELPKPLPCPRCLPVLFITAPQAALFKSAHSPLLIFPFFFLSFFFFLVPFFWDFISNPHELLPGPWTVQPCTFCRNNLCSVVRGLLKARSAPQTANERTLVVWGKALSPYSPSRSSGQTR